jgi:hypothetical protein
MAHGPHHPPTAKGMWLEDWHSWEITNSRHAGCCLAAGKFSAPCYVWIQRFRTKRSSRLIGAASVSR